MIPVWRAVALGVSSMVGAGIFALLGEARALAGATVWVAFLAGRVVGIIDLDPFSDSEPSTSYESVTRKPWVLGRGPFLDCCKLWPIYRIGTLAAILERCPGVNNQCGEVAEFDSPAEEIKLGEWRSPRRSLGIALSGASQSGHHFFSDETES